MPLSFIPNSYYDRVAKKQNVDSMASTIAGIQTAAAALTGRVTTTETLIGALQSAVGTLQSAASAVAARMTSAESAITSLQSLCSAIQSAATTLAARVTATESSISGLQTSYTSLATRVSALEIWRGAKAAAIPKLNYTTGGIGVSIIGVSVSVASATSVKAIADKVDVILDALKNREITL